MGEERKYYLCPKNHVIPATAQFYHSIPLNEVDANLDPLYSSGLWCSSCEKGYVLSDLKKKEGDSDLINIVHDLQLFRHVEKNPS